MNKLAKLVKNFQEKHLSNEMVRTLHDYQVLRKNLSMIFPDEESIEILSAIQPNVENKNIKSYSDDFLPLHTRDEKWLAKYIDNMLNKNKYSDAPAVKLKNIESFVKKDPEFDAERNRYEQDLVFVEIENMLIERKPNDTSDYKTMQDRVNKSFNADETFRNEILHKMTNFGLDAHNVEATLETYADIWRPEAMDKTYINRYVRPLVLVKDQVSKAQYIQILDNITAQRSEWVGFREKHYYERHKKIINELDLATPNMKVPNEDVYEKETAWQRQYQTNIIPVWDLIYNQSENYQITKKQQIQERNSLNSAPLEPIIEK